MQASQAAIFRVHFAIFRIFIIRYFFAPVNTFLRILKRFFLGDFMYKKFDDLLKKNHCKASTVADAIGIRRGFLSDWKAGRTKQPKIETLTKIADYFNVPVSYFYGEDIALSLAERQAQQLGIDTDALKKELSLKSLDEQTMYVLKEFQKLDDTQKAAIEAVIKGFLQTKS